MSHILGIDLGSTLAKAAVCTEAAPRFLTALPSVVAFPKKGDPITGETARRQAYMNPGRSCTDILSSLAGTQRKEVDGHFYSAVEIAGLLLRELRARAQAAMGEEFRRCVLTVPDSFGWEERRALREAAGLAGFHVEGFLVESCAAALGCGILKESSGPILLCDAGGDSFKATVLNAGEGGVRRLSAVENSDCGGSHFDSCIAAWLLQRFQEDHGIDLSRDLNAMQRIIEAAELSKCRLSTDTVAMISIPYITAEKDGPLHLDYQLSRSVFQEITARLAQKIRLTVEKALAEGGETETIVLTGGAASMPLVQEAVGRTVYVPTDHKNCTVFGAALAAKYNFAGSPMQMA